MYLTSFPSAGSLLSRLERHLSLPRNTALDLASGEANNLTALQQHADALVRLCRRAEHTAFSRFKALDPIAMQAGKALGEAYGHLHQASTLSQNANAAE